MSTDNTDANASTEAEGTEADPIKNLKSEVSRKFDNISAANAALAQQNAEIKAQLDALVASQRSTNTEVTPSKGKKAPDMYDDPEGYAQYVAEIATRAATDNANRTVNSNNEFNSTVAQLTSEYPEFQNNTSELSLETLKIFNSLPKNEQNSRGIRYAAREAAAIHGIVPVAKRARTSNPDDFDHKGSGGGQRPPAPKKTKLDPNALEFAKLMGKDINDPKYIESLTKAAQRDSYNKYK